MWGPDDTTGLGKPEDAVSQTVKAVALSKGNVRDRRCVVVAVGHLGAFVIVSEAGESAWTRKRTLSDAVAACGPGIKDVLDTVCVFEEHGKPNTLAVTLSNVGGGTGARNGRVAADRKIIQQLLMDHSFADDQTAANAAKAIGADAGSQASMMDFVIPEHTSPRGIKIPTAKGATVVNQNATQSGAKNACHRVLLASCSSDWLLILVPDRGSGNGTAHLQYAEQAARLAQQTAQLVALQTAQRALAAGAQQVAGVASDAPRPQQSQRKRPGSGSPTKGRARSGWARPLASRGAAPVEPPGAAAGMDTAAGGVTAPPATYFESAALPGGSLGGWQQPHHPPQLRDPRDRQLDAPEEDAAQRDRAARQRDLLYQQSRQLGRWGNQLMQGAGTAWQHPAARHPPPSVTTGPWSEPPAVQWPSAATGAWLQQRHEQWPLPSAASPNPPQDIVRKCRFCQQVIDHRVEHCPCRVRYE